MPTSKNAKTLTILTGFVAFRSWLRVNLKKEGRLGVLFLIVTSSSLGHSLVDLEFQSIMPVCRSCRSFD